MNFRSAFLLTCSVACSVMIVGRWPERRQSQVDARSGTCLKIKIIQERTSVLKKESAHFWWLSALAHKESVFALKASNRHSVPLGLADKWEC